MTKLTDTWDDSLIVDASEPDRDSRWDLRGALEFGLLRLLIIVLILAALVQVVRDLRPTLTAVRAEATAILNAATGR